MMRKVTVIFLALSFLFSSAAVALAGGGFKTFGKVDGETYTNTQTDMFKNFGHHSFEMGMSAKQDGETDLSLKGRDVSGNFGYKSGYNQEQSSSNGHQTQWGMQYGNVKGGAN